MHAVIDLHDIEAVRDRFNAYVVGVGLETGYVMGRTVDDFTFRG